ncbi:hypothetical protein DSL64_17755 [Dyadobacter luteus]|uniref:WG repeat-containing protein n=1 Tax=Dyadobacter luteus TaxID=2259619 RepID=A0A3D8Y8F9_9BACT|nr:WG repeat-containing protein [Dyadobacter luteus]REA59496.1 hypothetical protein DSL64_17755 [Dyadobacter luteus]
MKLQYIICMFFLSPGTLLAQEQSYWTAFMNANSSLIGYKDKNDHIRIPPRFETYSPARKFDDIIAVHEQVSGKISSYYLSKSGRVTARDSMYVFDNTLDCESEGFIRFRDQKTDRAGLLNKSGNIAIPAVYNDLSRVENGLIIALSGANKKQSPDGEHTMWEGGKYILIDTTNQLLIDNFEVEDPISLHTLQVSDKPGNDHKRKYFKGLNGKYYGFIDTDAEFKLWLKTTLLTERSESSFHKATFEEIKYWDESSGWISENGKTFIEQNFNILQKLLARLNAPDCQYDIFNESLNPFLFESELFSSYLNNCNEALENRYPVKNIVISHGKGVGVKQDHLAFLRTDSGYKLISVSLSTERLR